ncbi:vanadium-dependent haloperoxidase [Streptomyces sp. NPDC058701]|uniref:vanadium-dependent haloperoxidase n=1 Tax=Streptomyces sp. NPDC058701 TaxID=3346608 RepID=UPI0036562A93
MPQQNNSRRRINATALAFLAALVMVAAVLLPARASGSAKAANAFDLDTGNAYTEVFLPYAFKAIPTLEVPDGDDPTIALRWVSVTDLAAFDSIAPYHPTAIGVYSNLGRRPTSERATNRYKNIALLHGMYRAHISLFPNTVSVWREMLTSVGLDSDDTHESTTDPVGIGNKAGNAVVAARLHDGMNQLGDEGGVKYNRVRYRDYTGYQPVNTAYQLRDPSRWQPLFVPKGNGIIQTQQFVTPQLGNTKPYTFPRSKLEDLRVPPPVNSDPRTRAAGYRQQTRQILNASAHLTDSQKMAAEFFNDKYQSLGGVDRFIAKSRHQTLDQVVQFAATITLAQFDTSVVVWSEKRRYDAIRPVSTVRYLYGDKKITAWGGPGKGTVNDITGNEWRSYINTGDHPEYPSGSAAFCSATAQVMRSYLGSDDLGWVIPVTKGSSLIEPGITPAADLELRYDTWTDFERTCGQSRMWAGVHFPDATYYGAQTGHKVANIAVSFMRAHINGTVS